MARQFVPVNFSTGQLIDEDTLNTLNNNTLILRDQAVDGKWFDSATLVDTGIKVLAGRIYIPGTPTDVYYGQVAFPSFFTVGCLPVLTHSIMSPSQMNKFMSVHYGIGYPYVDHRGFGFKVNIRDNAGSQSVFDKELHFQYIAVGW